MLIAQLNQKQPSASRQAAFSRLREAIDQAHGLASELESRLGPVLSPAGPDAPGLASEMGSPLADAARTLEAANDRLRSLLSRIDL